MSVAFVNPYTLNDNAMKDARREVQAALTSDSDKEAAGKAFSEALQDEGVKKQAYEDVKKLAETIRGIREGFIKVRGDLVGFDAAEFKDKNGQVIKLGPKWQPHIQMFDDTLQFSLEQATESVVMMKSIYHVLGDVTPELGPDLKIELEHFMTQLDKKEDDAHLVKDKFQELADNVKLFSSEIDAALDSAMEAIKQDLQRAKDRLKDLENQLRDLESKIKSLGIATITEVATGGAAAVAACITLNPVAIGTALVSLFGAIGTAIALKKAIDDRNTCLGNIDSVNREIVRLNERAELLKKYRESLEGTKTIVGDISEQIAVIGNIWQTINLDMHGLHTDLVNNMSPGAPITGFFFAKIKVAKEIYKHLTLLLETYVEQVRATNAF